MPDLLSSVVPDQYSPVTARTPVKAIALALLVAGGCAPRLTPPHAHVHEADRAALPAVKTEATRDGAAVQAPITVPVWRVGDEWAYRWDAPSSRGIFVWEVAGVQSIGGVPHYVVKADTRRIYYRVDDLGFTREELDGRVVREITPSNWRFAAFPLKVGSSWTMKYHEERPADGQSEEVQRRCTVDGEETISVPAGTFPTLRIACRNLLTDAWIMTIWYSPQVKHLVREETAVAGGTRLRELITFGHR
jgi:hypothetical protein